MYHSDMSHPKNNPRESIGILEKPKTQEPSFYKVLLLNDDYTPMEFVTHVLKKFFSKSREEAEKIMLQVHHQGKGIAGVYNHETAETKMHLVNTYSDQQGHPLQCTIEKE